VSTDTNPVHIDAEAAEKSPFGERVAHGMLSAGLISAVLGTRLPGPGTIYLGQTLRFRAPVKIGATVTATAEITALDPERKRATLKTTCTVAGKTVIEGEATVMVPSRG
jgi:3-hydroxybutyryl-CoA dehydratase